MMTKSINWPYAILIGIILIMGYYLIFNKPDVVIEPFDEAPLREEIRLADSISLHWKEEAALMQALADSEKHKSDSLEKFKPSIKYYYEKKYTFNANADILQLDSVVRANW
jgi:hypothetical protein